jgi:peptidoglycan hydrolase-like protein with peptidoglycan-binding domain
VSSITWKSAAWVSGAALAVGGCAAGIVIAAQIGGRADADHTVKTAAVGPAAAQPLRVVSVSPPGGARDVNGAGSITVTYNQPLPAAAALPVLSPAVAGSWKRSGDAAVFQPAAGYPPGTHVTVTATVTGDASARSKGASTSKGAGTRSAAAASFTTGRYSTLRLQQVLAQLGYLPLTWTPAAGAAAPAGNAAAQLAAAYAPPAGTFRWERGYPAELHSFWAQGTANTLDQGAVTGFEADHGLPADGTVGAAVWKALLTAAAAGQRNTHGYSYAIARQQQPETLTIWHDGRQVFSSPANTGIAASPTGIGTFPVYEKLPFQVMQGINPDGTRYSDPVEWVSYFDGGDAVHYFDRYSYGWQQSLGCVELPYTAAEKAYPFLPYGTLVTVTAE